MYDEIKGYVTSVTGLSVGVKSTGDGDIKVGAEDVHEHRTTDVHGLKGKVLEIKYD